MRKRTKPRSLSIKLKQKTLTKRKYGNKPKNGFDSTAEYKRHCYLSCLRDDGKISNLRCQVSYRFPSGGCYIADFVYCCDGKVIVEDVKHPMLFIGSKFRNNVAKMRLHFGLHVYAIKPSMVSSPLPLAQYR